MVQRPLQLGGLGVLDLELFGQALRLRWLWTQRLRVLSSPPRLLHSKSSRGLAEFFNRSVLIEIGNGKSVFFWTDRWLNNHSIAEMAPHLVDAVPLRTRRSRTVADALHNINWRRDIKGPLTIPVLIDYIRVREATQDIILQPLVKDNFRWKWTPSGEFSSSSAYQAFFIGQTATPGARQLWKTKAPNKCRFFIWLALHGRVWTAERRHRHGLQPADTCVLCSQQPETLDHLLLQCVFSREVWFKALRELGWQNLTPSHDAAFVDWWLLSRRQIPKPRRKAFDSVVVLIAWYLWLERNARTFQRAASPVAVVLTSISEAIALWCRAHLIVGSALNPG